MKSPANPGDLVEVHFGKIYKEIIINNINMFPSDLSGSLDVLFAFVVVGFKGIETPEIATIALGPIFIFLGIFTMFTSYLALGNSLKDHLIYDFRFKKINAWFLSSLIPIFIFLLVKMSKYFTFTKILSIGGAVSGGLIAVLIFLMIKRAKIKGNRKPEYKIPVNWLIIILFSLIFSAGIVREILTAVR